MQEDALLRAFGLRLQQHRHNKGWSQEKLAELCSLDRTYISSIERGRRNVSLINIYKLAAVLECPPHDLFPEKGDGA